MPPAADAEATRPRALVVADSDSYLKWGVSRALDLADAWEVEVIVVANAVTPSAEQRATAVDGRLAADPAVVRFADLVARLREDPPALLLLACRGPLIELLLLDELGGRRAADVVVTGIPGIWFPPTPLGVRLRAGCDLIVVHSERERRAVRELLPEGRLRDVGLASLLAPVEVAGAPRPRVVFAPQSLVPRAIEDRRRLLEGLIASATRHPDLDVVIKLRGGAAEAQTHAEIASFEELSRGMRLPANLVFARGPLREYLGDCVGFVTVSSTAALEAIDADVPVLILDDFGVSAEVINAVFEGSGLFGGLDDLAALRFHSPDPAWREDNYFHAGDDWTAVARLMAEAPAASAPLGDPLAGTMRVARRVRRRSVALGAADDTMRGRLLAPVRAALRGYDRARAAVRARRRSPRASGHRG